MAAERLGCAIKSDLASFGNRAALSNLDDIFQLLKCHVCVLSLSSFTCPLDFPKSPARRTTPSRRRYARKRRFLPNGFFPCGYGQADPQAPFPCKPGRSAVLPFARAGESLVRRFVRLLISRLEIAAIDGEIICCHAHIAAQPRRDALASSAQRPS